MDWSQPDTIASSATPAPQPHTTEPGPLAPPPAAERARSPTPYANAPAAATQHKVALLSLCNGIGAAPLAARRVAVRRQWTLAVFAAEIEPQALAVMQHQQPDHSEIQRSATSSA